MAKDPHKRHDDHNHADHGHDHQAPVDKVQRRLGIAIALTMLFVVGEAIAGYRAQSLALLSDAGHNFADALALLLSAGALWMQRKPAHAGRTYGYHRVGILVAFANALSLVAISALIFWEAFQRFESPVAAESGPMIWVALIALLLNAGISLSLHKSSKQDLNLRSAYLHMLGDAIAAVGVVIAGVVIKLTAWHLADPVVSVLIGALILWSSWSILVDSVNVLLEGSPKGLDMAALESAIRATPGVDGLHDLHVWSVTSGVVACSCHILVADQSVRSGQQVLRSVSEMLGSRFKISHTTIQVEVEGCEPSDVFCTLEVAASGHHGHSH